MTGTCKLKTPHCNEEWISHRRNDSIQSGAGRNRVNVNLCLDWHLISTALLCWILSNSTFLRYFWNNSHSFNLRTAKNNLQNDENLKRRKQINLLTQTMCLVTKMQTSGVYRTGWHPHLCHNEYKLHFTQDAATCGKTVTEKVRDITQWKFTKGQ